jgi:glycine cleavage system H lipoate-binding protein
MVNDMKYIDGWLAKIYLAYSEQEIETLLKVGELIEIGSV